jgi:hypothetical protein
LISGLSKLIDGMLGSVVEKLGFEFGQLCIQLSGEKDL